MRKFLFALLPVLVLAACGGGSNHPLAGNWSQDTGSEAKGMSLEFDSTGTKVVVHTAPRADGGHDHPKASFTFDAATKALVVKCELLGAGKPDTWTGTLGTGQFELKGGDTVLKFRSGGKPAGH